MFTKQKKRLSEACLVHEAAVRLNKEARAGFTRRREQFLREPFNLLYPYSAGILICASQLKNEASGMRRIPFLNIVKAGVGLWTVIYRIQKVKESKLNNSTQEKSLNQIS